MFRLHVFPSRPFAISLFHVPMSNTVGWNCTMFRIFYWAAPVCHLRFLKNINLMTEYGIFCWVALSAVCQSLSQTSVERISNGRQVKKLIFLKSKTHLKSNRKYRIFSSILYFKIIHLLNFIKGWIIEYSQKVIWWAINCITAVLNKAWPSKSTIRYK